MSNLSHAADSIKSMAAKFKGFLEVADALDKIGSIEQAERDAIIAKDKAYKDLEEGKMALAELQGDYEAADKKLIEIQKACVAKEEAAKAKAIDIVSEANKTAEQIIKNAEFKKTEFDKYVAQKNDALNLINSEISQKKAEYDNIVEKIKEVKAKLSAFVG